MRTSTERDAAAFVAYFGRNRAHLEPWEPEREVDFFTEAFWASRLGSYDEERARGTTHRMCIMVPSARSAGPDADELIGLISLTSILARAPVWNARVGYSLDRSREGQGLMGEALGLVIRYAFDVLRLKRLLAGFIPQNSRSARVLERAGFVREGYHREYFFVGGKWEDHVETSLIHAGWRHPSST